MNFLEFKEAKISTLSFSLEDYKKAVTRLFSFNFLLNNFREFLFQKLFFSGNKCNKSNFSLGNDLLLQVDEGILSQAYVNEQLIQKIWFCRHFGLFQAPTQII
eukprot:TRINITY_DN29475_c0_g2_i4.p9 TRINITY_DN29475_c0_g2~~TRINITY_DN29475_c0_g2_i4.p9  ORF type:complete len:103 (+),score=10.97 TRINITY_DN29475_c0_g2_i4:1456-1764(+)